MPNWVMNDFVAFAATREELDALLDIILSKTERQEATFGRLFPDYDPKREDWYDWNVKNLGTKWEPTDLDVYGPINADKAYGPRSWRLDLVFSSAWSPPLGIMHQIAERFPKLKFRIRYDEPGMAFKGHQWWNNGKMTKDVSVDY